MLVSQLFIVVQNQTHILLENCQGGSAVVSYIFHLVLAAQNRTCATATLICGHSSM